MNCDDMRPLLDASLDRELSAADDWRVRQHLATCADCQRDSAALHTVAGALRSATYHRAPASLRAGIIAALPALDAGVVGAAGAARAEPARALVGFDEVDAVGVRGRSGGVNTGHDPQRDGLDGARLPSMGARGQRDQRGRRGWREWLSAGLLFPGLASRSGSGDDGRDGRGATRGHRVGDAAGAAGAAGGGANAGTGGDPTRGVNPVWLVALGFALCAAVVTLVAGTQWLRHTGDDGGPFVDELVASHVRAELSGRDIDVISTDRHTVKPWFNGRIDYAPPVVDLAAQGFALAGGRLDYVGHERVAVLVYRYRKHVIDVYVFPPGAHGADGAAPVAPRDGYAVARWQADGMAWWAVSDAEPDALAALHKALEDHLQAAQTEQDKAGG